MLRKRLYSGNYNKQSKLGSMADLTGDGILLDRFSFVSFMVVGPKEAGTLGLGLDDNQARSLHTLIHALKGVRLYDFVYLLVSSRKTVHSKLCRA